jgi:parvulin-like peptidyl-prolyl isomerase
MKLVTPIFWAGFLSMAALAADIKVLEEIVAKVNGEVVTRSELDRSRKQAEAEMKQQGQKAQQLEAALKQREADLLRDRIDQLLLVNRAKELSINVDTELSKYMAEIQLQNKIGDPEKFQAWVKEQSGTSFEDFRAETKNGMLTQHVIRQEVYDKVHVPKPEVEKYYNEHKEEFVREERVYLREILVSTEGKDAAGVAAAEKKAKELVARARKGEKFPELARDNSDSQSAQQGGDVGGYKKGEIDPALEKLVWDQPRNYVADPIKRPNGFLILRVDEHQKAGQASLEEAEPQIMDVLYRPLVQPKIREYLTRLRQDAFLEIREGYLDSGAAPGKDTRWTDPAQLKPETVTKEEVLGRQRHKRLLFIPVPNSKKGSNVKVVDATTKTKSKTHTAP